MSSSNSSSSQSGTSFIFFFFDVHFYDLALDLSVWINLLPWGGPVVVRKSYFLETAKQINAYFMEK